MSVRYFGLNQIPTVFMAANTGGHLHIGPEDKGVYLAVSRPRRRVHKSHGNFLLDTDEHR